MNKKTVIWLLAAIFLANISLAEAQQPNKVRRIGYLSNAGKFRKEAIEGKLLKNLHDIGYIEGENLVVEGRFTK